MAADVRTETRKVRIITVGGCPEGAARKHTWAVKAGVPMCLRCGLAIGTKVLAAPDLLSVEVREAPRG